jgi:hypothetical protein
MSLDLPPFILTICLQRIGRAQRVGRGNEGNHPGESWGLL